MNKKIFIITIFLSTIFLQLASADLITPGYYAIKVTNEITNIQDYPKYKFIVINEGPMSTGAILDNNQINYISENGIISTPYYKYSQLSVYAIKNSKFNEEKMKNMSKDGAKEIEKYLHSIDAKKVISDITHYETKHVSDPIKEKNYYYKKDLQQTQNEPDNIEAKRSPIIYFYILIPLLCASIIIYILKKKKQNAWISLNVIIHSFSGTSNHNNNRMVNLFNSNEKKHLKTTGILYTD